MPHTVLNQTVFFICAPQVCVYERNRSMGPLRSEKEIIIASLAEIFTKKFGSNRGLSSISFLSDKIVKYLLTKFLICSEGIKKLALDKK